MARKLTAAVVVVPLLLGACLTGSEDTQILAEPPTSSTLITPATTRTPPPPPSSNPTSTAAADTTLATTTAAVTTTTRATTTSTSPPLTTATLPATTTAAPAPTTTAPEAGIVPTPTHEVTVSTVEFMPGLYADVHAPTQPGDYPVITLTFGRGWSIGDRTQLSELSRHLASRGMVAVNGDRLVWTEIGDELLSCLRVLNGHDTDLASDANRCRDALLAVSPALERVLGHRLTQPGVRDVPAKRSTPTTLGNAGRTKIRNAIRKRSPRLATRLTTRIVTAIDAQTVTLPAERTWGEVITNLISDLERIQTHHGELTTKIEQAFLDHPLGQVLNSLSGFGPGTDAKTLAKIGNPHPFQNESRLAAYAGLAPVNHRSGKSINRTTQHRGGNHRLKNAIFPAAFVASQHDPTPKAHHQRKRTEGKHHNAAIICVAHRPCDLILPTLKNQTPYNPHHPKTDLTNR